MEKLTEEQKDMLKYFWEERGDLERFGSFEEIKPLIEKDKPELLKAWNDYKIAKKIMDIIIKSL